ncbi:His-Xaa-Ser system protein HxsD [Candidatus Woesearchaeota archaeon]|nr:MAG: His-Xaa-Ser system protein HxsD [Candidatus Woesearchaeota archaeon]
MEKNIKIENDKAVLSINPKMYDLEVIYSATYLFLDKSYIILDGDPKKEILVKIKAKKGKDIEEIAHDFFNELINYSDYKKRADSTRKIRELILQRALATNDPNLVEDDEFDRLLKELDGESEESDENDMIVPWEDDEN